MSVLESIKEKLAVIAKQKEEMVEALRKDFAPMFETFFQKSNGLIKSIGWKQYTPYFNDGEECVFSVHSDLDYGISVNGEDLEESDLITIDGYSAKKYILNDGSYEKWIEKYPNDKIDPVAHKEQLDLYKILTEVEEVIKSIPDEFMKDLFGDHVEVTVNADGTIETEHYEHD